MDSLGRTLPSLAWLGLIALNGFVAPDARGQQTAPGKNALYVLTHVDIIGGAANLPNAIALMQQYAADSLKEPGAVRVEVLQQDNRRNHFMIFEVWQTRKAFEAHWVGETAKHFREKAFPMLGSPFDERLNELVE